MLGSSNEIKCLRPLRNHCVRIGDPLDYGTPSHLKATNRKYGKMSDLISDN